MYEYWPQDASVWEVLLFSYTTRVVMLGYTAASLEIGDLPILDSYMRATYNFKTMRAAMKRYSLRGRAFGIWKPTPGSGWQLAYRIMRVNAPTFAIQISIVVVAAFMFYAPAFFIQRLVSYLEVDLERRHTEWGWVYTAGLLLSNVILTLSGFSREFLSWVRSLNRALQ